MENDTKSKCNGLKEDEVYELKDTDFFSNQVGPDGSPIEGTAPESITLAIFELTNGNRFEFVGAKIEDNEVGVREIGGGPRESAPTFQPTSRMTVSEMYLKLAPKETPIPSMILSLDEKINKNNYKSVEFLETPILIDLDEIGIKSIETDSHYCDGGYNSFKHDFCDAASVTSNTWWWCDPQQHFHWRDRWTTNHKRRNSLGITAACGGGLGSTIHYYKNAFGNWKHNHTWTIPSGYWQWTKWEGGSKRDRWIRHHPLPQGGNSYVRCVSFFWT